MAWRRADTPKSHLAIEIATYAALAVPLPQCKIRDSLRGSQLPPVVQVHFDQASALTCQMDSPENTGKSITRKYSYCMFNYPAEKGSPRQPHSKSSQAPLCRF